MSRIVKTRFDLLLPKNSTYQLPSAALQDALQIEFQCLREATQTESIKQEPRYFMLYNDPLCKYRTKPMDVRPSAHAGQLKLFISELWFLRKYASKSSGTIVYAGAADGRHIAFLAELFKKMKFILYDPRPFHKNVWGPNIVLKNQLFSMKEALLYENKNILFVSDIRSGDPKDPFCDFDQCVNDDMQKQKEWVKLMKPCCSMLKFRLSYKSGKTFYFLGQLRYGIFATQSSTELRLIVRNPSFEIEYDNTEMEEKCYYFNNFTRAVRYHHFFNFSNNDLLRQKWLAKGIDFCWDCCAFLRVCYDFLMERNQCQNENDLFEFVCNCIDKCNAFHNLKLSPHGDNFDQWIYARNAYHGQDIWSKGNTATPNIADFLHRVYSNNAEIAPPLGNYCGSMF